MPVSAAHLLSISLGIVLAAASPTSTLTDHSAETGSGSQAASGASPVTIGNQVAGTFADATGHSSQSHLVFAANSNVWLLFTLTSQADGQGGTNHLVKSFRSSGPDLETASWTQASDSPGAQAAAGGFMGGGRALSVAYVNNSPTDVIHAEIAMAADGGDGITGHIRAVVTATTVSWGSWNYYDEPAATWTLPRSTSIGVSTGKYIHTAGPILQQEVDANARKSTNPDTGSSWTTGFSSVSVIDNSMIHENNAMAFAPLASNAMLAVYDNGGGTSTCYNCGQVGAPEPNLTNVRYKKSNPDGSWPGTPVASQGGGDGPVFSSDATINQNDWTLVPVNTSVIMAFRTKATGKGFDGAVYNASANTWSTMSVTPAALATGQAFKPGAGLFGATDGTAIWLFFVNTDTPNSIEYSRFDGTSWSAWAIVPGTGSGTHTRNYISGYPVASSNQVGLIWTEGASAFNVVTTSLSVTAPAPLRVPAPPTGLRMVP